MSEKMLNNHMDPTWKMHMQTLMKMKRQIETKEIIETAIEEWYFENGKEIPNWKINKDPQWWIDYLKELEKDR